MNAVKAFNFPGLDADKDLAFEQLFIGISIFRVVQPCQMRLIIFYSPGSNYPLSGPIVEAMHYIPIILLQTALRRLMKSLPRSTNQGLEQVGYNYFQSKRERLLATDKDHAWQIAENRSSIQQKPARIGGGDKIAGDNVGDDKITADQVQGDIVAGDKVVQVLQIDLPRLMEVNARACLMTILRQPT